MKKSMIFVGLLAIGYANAQTAEELKGRIGINTETPRASLEIKRHEGLPQQNVQGFLIPQLTQEQRNAMTKASLTIGLQIFNTDKTCVDWWNGSTWQCMDGSLQDNHGDPFTPPKTTTETYTEAITIYKSDCPAGQQAVRTAFRNFAKGDIIGTGTGVGRTQAIAYDEAIKKAKQDFYRKAQETVNNQFSGSQYCESKPLALPPVTPNIPQNVEIGNGMHFWSSIYDADYLNADGTLETPTGLASTEHINAKGYTATDENIIDRQGTITTSGIVLKIPIKLTEGTGAYIGPWTHDIEIPAEYTEDNRASIVRMYWSGTNVYADTKFLNIRIQAINNEVKLKKLDLVNGQGADRMGMIIGTFRFPKNKNEMVDHSLWSAKFDLRLISGIPDRNFTKRAVYSGQIQNNAFRFVYTPEWFPDGSIWLKEVVGLHSVHTAKISPTPSYAGIFAGSTSATVPYLTPQWGTDMDLGAQAYTGSTGSKSYTTSYGANYAAPTGFVEHCPPSFRTPIMSDPIYSKPFSQSVYFYEIDHTYGYTTLEVVGTGSVGSVKGYHLNDAMEKVDIRWQCYNGDRPRCPSPSGGILKDQHISYPVMTEQGKKKTSMEFIRYPVQCIKE